MEKQIDKFILIKEMLDDFTTSFSPDFSLYIEGIFIKPAFLHSSEMLLKLHGFLILYFIKHKIHFVPPTIIKKAITGKGNSSKEDVRKKLEEKYHIVFQNNDQSDAFALMEYYLLSNKVQVDNRNIDVRKT